MIPADSAPPEWAGGLVATASGCGSDVAAALRLAVETGRRMPVAGTGRTAERWSALAALARANVTVARVVEAHVDALAILAEAGVEVGSPDQSWGVFAAEGGSTPVRATAHDDGVVLSGTKPWCSLGDVLDAALVTATVDDAGTRRLFAIDLHHPGVTPHPATGWVSRGLPTVVSVGIDLDSVTARAVGDVNWYLERPGFAWGGMGVAACWYGAAAGVADLLAGTPRDDLAALHAGRVDLALHASACVLADAAHRIDAGELSGAAAAPYALRVRSIVAAAAEDVLREVGHARGPAPLTFDENHAARVADLGIYLRQHHGERDVAALGHTVGDDR